MTDLKDETGAPYWLLEGAAVLMTVFWKFLRFSDWLIMVYFSGFF